MEELTLRAIQRVAKMPRAHQFTVGDRLVETCLQITSELVDASFTRDRRALLASASRGLTRARLLVRLPHRLGLLGEMQSLYFREQSAEIGKMLGGWARAERGGRPPPADAG